MTAPAMLHSAPAWSLRAIDRLLDTVKCPVCDRGEIVAQHCPACDADFRDMGAELWTASEAAVDALRARQAVLERVPIAAPAVAPGAAAETRAAAVAAAGPTRPEAPGDAPAASGGGVGTAPPPSAGSSATVQSVLAVAGAGLVAIAAVVFTFFNPDLTDPLPRALIVGAIAAAFLGGAMLLSRRGLRFSAESVGALGVVFLALTVTAVAPLLPPALDPWVYAALAALIAGGALSAGGARRGIRSWSWSGRVALALAPAMLAMGATSPIATVAGCLASAAAASALVALTGRAATAPDQPLTAERVTLTVLQFGFVLVAVATVPAVGAIAGAAVAYFASGALLAVAALAVASARHPAGALWSVVAGGASVGAVAVLPLAAVGGLSTGGWAATFPSAAAAGLIAIGAARPLHRAVSRTALFGGALAAVAVIAIIPTLAALLLLASLLFGRGEEAFSSDISAGITSGLAALALGLAGFAAATSAVTSTVARAVTPPAMAAATDLDLTAAPQGEASGASYDVPPAREPIGTRWLAVLGAWYGALAFFTLLGVPGIPLRTRAAIALVAAIGVSATTAATRLHDASSAARLPFVVGAHGAVAIAAVLSWREPDLTVPLGIAVVAAIGVVALTVPRAARFVHVAIAFSYALVILATALDRAGLDVFVVLCLATCAAGVVAIAATFLRRVPVRGWLAILAVTAVPFVIGVVQVVFERSGWTALSTGVVFLLALTLVTTARTGLGVVVRTLAAATLVPALSVVAVCLGAQFLEMSGSPVVLPVIAVVVAAVLASGEPIGVWLARRMPQPQARAATLAIEASAVLTAVIAVALSLTREAAGLPTTLVVLVVLGIGFAAAARFAGRRYGWWLSGVALTGALWSAWGLAGVIGLEPYLMPPALAAAAVGAVLTARGRRATGLYATGLAAAVAPVLVALAVEPGSTRAYALVVAAWVLVVLATLVTRGSAVPVRRMRVLRAATLGIAIAAAAAAPVQAVRWGLGLDAPPPVELPLIVTNLAFGLVAAGAAAVAARALRVYAPDDSALARTRWLGAPAVLYVAVATWPAIERTWFAIWTMWGLAVALLVLMVAISARGLRRETGLPPVWFVFGVAFATAIVAWSPRDLRVEWFSLPLGLFLLAAGALAMRSGTSTERALGSAADAPVRSLASWPAGWTGSWALLAPGLAVMLSASVAATYTDPRTWRAILVMVIALLAILVGATRRLAAPFLIGIVVLPVENVLAFMVQIGRGIEAMPWWITLSIVGAVLLIIAVGYERRSGDDAGIAARLRDLT